MVIENTKTAASSKLSARNGKRSTAPMSPADMLEIFQQGMRDLYGVGVSVQYYERDDISGTHQLILALSGVHVCQKCHNLRLWEHMDPGRPTMCQKCADEDSGTAQAVSGTPA